jgi:two-component system, OmpR family, response regulator ResD
MRSPSAVRMAERSDIERQRRRVMIVEDDDSIRELVSQYLQLEGYEVIQATNGLEGLQLAVRHPADLVILDLTLPGIDGFEVARRLRVGSAVPILMLTGRVGESDKLEGFGVGADDYITKPFLPRELLVRVQAVMRRMAATSVPAMVLDDALQVGSLIIRPHLREVLRDGESIDLTAKEFDLLYFLAAHPKQVFSRQQLLLQVWNYEFGDENTVTVHMSRLRTKVEPDPSKPIHLRTVWHVGYKFEP